MGRKDTRVKIHGYRIELSEIEEALVHQPEVEGAVVCARETPNHDPQLVAYVTPRAGKKLTRKRCGACCAPRFPAYMVPTGFVFLERFPLTRMAKLTGRRCRRRQKTGRRSGAKPRDVVEATGADLGIGLGDFADWAGRRFF